MRDQADSAPNGATQLRTCDLARLTGVGKATIEHYLRLDLLRPVGVGAQGYRLFDDDAVARIRVIRSGRHAGFALRELHAMLQVVAPAELHGLLATLSPSQCRAVLAARGVALGD